MKDEETQVTLGLTIGIYRWKVEESRTLTKVENLKVDELSRSPDAPIHNDAARATCKHSIGATPCDLKISEQKCNLSLPLWS